MQIKIEIDLKPEELQRFLGLPDVAGMREELLLFIKERIAADPAGFLRDNLKQLGKNAAVRRILYGSQTKSHGERRGRARSGDADTPPARAPDPDDGT